MALATSSSLNAHRSSMEPPPRAYNHHIKPHSVQGLNSLYDAVPWLLYPALEQGKEPAVHRDFFDAIFMMSRTAAPVGAVTIPTGFGVPEESAAYTPSNMPISSNLVPREFQTAETDLLLPSSLISWHRAGISRLSHIHPPSQIRSPAGLLSA